jgi:hypothetical protein
MTKQPEDSISSFAWYPNTQMKMFASTQWDGRVKLYEAAFQQGYQGYNQA